MMKRINPPNLQKQQLKKMQRSRLKLILLMIQRSLILKSKKDQRNIRHPKRRRSLENHQGEFPLQENFRFTLIFRRDTFMSWQDILCLRVMTSSSLSLNNRSLRMLVVHQMVPKILFWLRERRSRMIQQESSRKKNSRAKLMLKSKN